MRYLITAAVFFGLVTALLAQQQQQGSDGFVVEQDTTAEVEGVPLTEGKKSRLFEGRPGKAALFSLILPGAGQIYNKRYWKAPIVWAAVGGVGYVMVQRINTYQDFRDRYYAAIEASDMGLPPPEGEIYTISQLEQLRNTADRNKQVSIFLFAGVWLIQSIEAYTDAHLKEFNIDDDLSFEIIMPEYDASTGVMSAGLAFRF